MERGEIAAQLVRLAFGQRRKKLSNALKVLEVGEVLEEMDLADLWAEQAGVADYLRIADELAH